MSSPKKKKSFKPKTQKSNLLDAAKAFSINEKPSTQEIAILRDLFYALVINTSVEDLEEISRVLARSVFTPRPIAMYLSMEPIEVSAPFLLISPVLNDSDLIAISNNRSVDYANVIIRRDNLSQRLKDHLEKLGANKENPETNIDRQLEVALPPVTENKKSELISITLAKPPKVEPTENTAAKPRDLSKELIGLANKSGKIERKRFTDQIIPNSDDLEATLFVLLRNGEHSQFADVLARRTGLDYKLLLDYITLDDIGRLAALYRALEFKATMSIRLLLLTSQNLGRNPGIFNQIFAMFEQLDVAECQAQFNKLGANFGSAPQTVKEPSRSPHFTTLLADRRRSVQSSGNVDQLPDRETRQNFGRRSTGT